MTTPQTRTLGVLLYPDFELLDVFGPLEMFGNLPGVVSVVMVAETRGLVRRAQGPSVHADHGFDDCPRLDFVLVPGGMGAHSDVEHAPRVELLRERDGAGEVVVRVCPGT